MKPAISGRRISNCMAIQVPNETPAIQPRARIWVLQPVKRRCRIGKFARSVVEITLAAPDTAEVEAQHREAAFHERVVKVIHDLIVHRATKLWMGMQDQGDGAIDGGFVVVARFEAAVRAADD